MAAISLIFIGGMVLTAPAALLDEVVTPGQARILAHANGRLVTPVEIASDAPAELNAPAVKPTARPALPSIGPNPQIVSVAPIPEPSTGVLLLASLFATISRRPSHRGTLPARCRK